MNSFTKVRPVNSIIKLPLVVIATSALLCSHTFAAMPTFNGEVSAGISHDSTLTVVELDQISNEADSALDLGAKAELKWQPNQAYLFNAAYSYQDKNYQKNDNYNLTLKQFSAGAELQFAGLSINELKHLGDLGIKHHVIDAELANTDFLALKLTSLYWSKLFQQRYYLRIAHDFLTKNFADIDDRNADTKNINAKAFVFFDNASCFVMFGVGKEKENTYVPIYAYDEKQFEVSYSQQFNWLNKKHKLQFSYQHKNRGYNEAVLLNPDSSEAQKRADKKQSIAVNWQLSLMNNLFLISELKFADYQSNFINADYDETLTSVMMKYKF